MKHKISIWNLKERDMGKYGYGFEGREGKDEKISYGI